MNKIEITMPIEPTGQMRARRGKIITTKEGTQFATMHKAKKQAVRESQIIAYIIPVAPPTPWTGPVMIELWAYMAMPQSWPKWKVENSDVIHPTKKPDLDNIVKHLKDCMTGIIYRDDAQVCWEIASKEFSDRPRWEIIVTELDEYRHDIQKSDLINDPVAVGNDKHAPRTSGLPSNFVDLLKRVG